MLRAVLAESADHYNADHTTWTAPRALGQRELRDLPEQELKDMLTSPDLAISYDYRRHVAELALTLARGRQGEGLHLWSAPGARHHPEMQPEVIRLTTEITLPNKSRRAP